ncbi:type II toxin-antitoxin system RelE/ParE family toxin [Thermococcus sp. Bubb.Bath]|uniref:type II toxin-antitoxin system RelE family toxin n=1 Tax=Thermococcus sp. Bubb.Bath TaxID=1638242 RepID=UPI00143919B0|nr:type II toxin-antitoxin system RelE/ParE family toxin [Thermococcus sp. Bubb.Bath]NJF25146.1 type II toxin-antitoxin system RelE/ParE family toxin [Thermococcus sp. Bubb.Bath]
MIYRVKVHRQVEKALLGLPKAHYQRFLEFRDILKYEPVPRQDFDIIKLKGGGDLELYRVRLGDYRVIYSVNWDERVIKILKLKPRGEAYK